MSSPMFNRFALVGGVVALTMGLMASTAFAEITLVPSGPYNASQTLEKVEITEAPTEATHVAISECNVSEASMFWGKRCYLNSGKGPSALSGGAFTFTSVPILREFVDTDFTVQPPKTGATETECENVENEGEPCGILASYYKPKMGGGLIPLITKTELAPILFK